MSHCNISLKPDIISFDFCIECDHKHLMHFTLYKSRMTAVKLFRQSSSCEATNFTAHGHTHDH